MAFRKTLVDRFLHMARNCGSHLRSNPTRKQPPEPDIRRRFAQSAAAASLPSGERLLDRIRSLNPDRIRLDGILPPNPNPNAISMAEVRKVLRAAQVEMARSRLRLMEKQSVHYEEFLRICCEVSSSEQGSAIAKSLDESGAVVVLGNLVFLRPDQELKCNEGLR